MVSLDPAASRAQDAGPGQLHFAGTALSDISRITAFLADDDSTKGAR